MNRPIRVLAVGVMLLFLALLGRVTYVQYFNAGSLNSVSAHPNNVRVFNAEYSRNRGAILVHNAPVARNVPSHDTYKYLRVYPHGRLYSDITGYYSRDVGLGGLESSQDKLLSGSDSSLFFSQLTDLLDNRNPKGGSVVLTLNPKAQAAAADGLRGKVGAVAAIEPSTGRVLAMATSPTYNPNRLASHHFKAAKRYKTHLLNEKPSPLDNGAIESRVPPGSTFKIITSAAALSSHMFTPLSPVPGTSSMKLPLSTHILTNENNESCGAATVSLTVALQNSCNVAFGTVGEKLGVHRLSRMAHRFGFGHDWFHDLDDPLTDTVPSTFPRNADAPGTVLAAIGQGEVAATPLQMAMVAAGVANNGTVMKPYLVQERDTADLDVLSRTSPTPLPNQPAVSPRVSRELTKMMVQVVTSGTGTPAQIPGVQVAGKTGTAQSASNRPPYAWFVSFAPAQNPKVAVAVLVQDGGVARDQISGGGLAAPIAKSVMEAVINK